MGEIDNIPNTNITNEILAIIARRREELPKYAGPQRGLCHFEGQAGDRGEAY